MKNNNTKLIILITFLAGSLFGMYVYDNFLVEQSTTTVETVTEYVPYEVIIHDTIHVEVPKKVYIKDTVIKEVNYPLNNYSGVQATKYGDLLYSATTAGELIDLTFSPDFKFEASVPHTTTTITKKITPRGLFLGASITNMLVPSVGVAYLNKDWLINYNFSPSISQHQVGISKRIF